MRGPRIICTLQPPAGAQVVEIGCGWAELLLRIATSGPTVTCVGIDIDTEAIEHGRAQAVARGFDDRVELDVADASQKAIEGADIAICVGASHAWGATPAALDALRQMVRPGGRVLFGEGFWLRKPTDAAVAALARTEHLDGLDISLCLES